MEDTTIHEAEPRGVQGRSASAVGPADGPADVAACEPALEATPDAGPDAGVEMKPTVSRGEAKARGRRRTLKAMEGTGVPGAGDAAASEGALAVPRVTVPAEMLPGAVEAVLMASERPMTAARLAAVLGLARDESSAGAEAAGAIEAAVASLNEQYAAGGRSFRIEPLSGGYRMMSLPAYAPYLAEFYRTRNVGRLTRASVETLAIIAYQQPITRAQLEAIRGVSCGEVLRSLTERRLVTIKGRAEELGRPLLYGTTKQFLDAFGLSSVKDLPTMTEFKFAAGAGGGVGLSGGVAGGTGQTEEAGS